MYNMADDTYSCDACGFTGKRDVSDDAHGDLWGCEECGSTFCTDRFIKAHGLKAYDYMTRENDKILCPSCFKKEFPERTKNGGDEE